MGLSLACRLRLSEAQNHRCAYCGTQFGDEGILGSGMTADHVIPRSKGGSDDPDNIVMACWLCNTVRGNDDALAFFELVQREGRPFGGWSRGDQSSGGCTGIIGDRRAVRWFSSTFTSEQCAAIRRAVEAFNLQPGAAVQITLADVARELLQRGIGRSTFNDIRL